MEAVVHSTTAVFITRFVVPVLITVVGFFGAMTLSDLKEGQKVALQRAEEIRQSFWAAQGSLAHTQNDMSVRLGVLGEKVDQLGRRMDKLDSKP